MSWKSITEGKSECMSGLSRSCLTSNSSDRRKAPPSQRMQRRERGSTKRESSRCCPRHPWTPHAEYQACCCRKCPPANRTTLAELRHREQAQTNGPARLRTEEPRAWCRDGKEDALEGRTEESIPEHKFWMVSKGLTGLGILQRRIESGIGKRE